ncbi:MAG: class I SAM-dependent methyltransferase [Candidatus Doudnabacteria bacterium]|nr:class I SAM-dependent methyltransferase [Candidatus Doudnabacteria bacterium]
MEHHVYQQIYDVEKVHWWFCGRRKIIEQVLKSSIPTKVDLALDIGSGTGLNSLIIKQFAHRVEGLEMSAEAIRLSALRAPELKVENGSFPETKLTKNYDLVTLFDVLEHIKDDEESLKQIKTALKPGGLVVLSVPAYPWLWSEHDKVLHHFRRYTKADLKNLVNKVGGYNIEYVSYFNTTLFFPILAFRWLRNLFHFNDHKTDDFLVPKTLNKFLEKIFLFDRVLLKRNICPFGISLILVLRKNK